MYGLLLESVKHSIIEQYGEEIWKDVKECSGVAHAFSTHQYYAETSFPAIVRATNEVTGYPTEEIMENCGASFVSFMSQYGYDMILKVLGRHMRDFLNGLDNLHEYLRNSYPKMRSPSFFVENESYSGLTLHYRSKRRGYLHYVMGQIKQVGSSFYNTEVDIEVKEEEEKGGMIHVVLELHFDNRGFSERENSKLQKVAARNSMNFEVKPALFFRSFPFHILFDRNMKIKSIGSSLKYSMRDAQGKRLDFVFNLTRPPMGFTFDNILSHINNSFELASIKIVGKKISTDSELIDTESDSSGGTLDIVDTSMLHMKLKGQMKYLENLDSLIYLATPILDNIDRMFELGLFINDLSMHDVSRDLVLIGIQQSKELKSALNQEKQRSKRLGEITKMVESEIRRTDSLLYQMIPREVADSMRKGDSAINTCQVFKEVSIMFSDVVNFTEICSQVTPMQIVCMLNSYFTKLDRLTEKHKVYKVETIGATYMIVSGAPTKHKNHAVYISEMSLDAIQAVQEVTDPSCGDHVCLRIGIHSGPIVAGVVGLQVPRYCLFGDTVNTASRMQSNGDSMSIHITEVTKQLLESHPYEVQPRGTITVKGKGEMNTYFLVRRTTDGPYHPPPSPKHGSALSMESRHKINGSRLSAKYTPISNEHVLASQGSLAAVTSIQGDAEVLSELDQKNGYPGNGHNTLESGPVKPKLMSECLGSRSATCVLF